MKSDLHDLKKVTLDLINNGSENKVTEKNQNLIEKIYGKESYPEENSSLDSVPINQEVQDISKVKSNEKYDDRNICL